MGNASEPERLSAAAEALLRTVSTATLSGQLHRRGFHSLFLQGVHPLRPDLRLVGQAVTLRYIPMREDLERTGDFDNTTNKQRIAIESVGPGEVLVVDARGDTRAGTLGNILATRMQQRGAAGIVTDGAFRDSPAIRQMDFPTYAAGQNPNLSLTIHHPVEINTPIACAGVAVLPGDVLVGDAEGVIVIPLALADEVAQGAAEQERREEFILQQIRAGRSIRGVYPPDAATLQEYEAWRRHRSEP